MFIEPPSFEMLETLRNPQFASFITYLEGSALNDRDLKRSKAETAVAIFIMTNKFTNNPDTEDAKIILERFSIKRYITFKHKNNNPLFYVQIILPENKKHLTTNLKDSNRNNNANNNNSNNSDINNNNGDDRDLIICLNEIKMGIISKSIMFPVSFSIDLIHYCSYF